MREIQEGREERGDRLQRKKGGRRRRGGGGEGGGGDAKEITLKEKRKKYRVYTGRET